MPKTENEPLPKEPLLADQLRAKILPYIAERFSSDIHTYFDEDWNRLEMTDFFADTLLASMKEEQIALTVPTKMLAQPYLQTEIRFDRITDIYSSALEKSHSLSPDEQNRLAKAVGRLPLRRFPLESAVSILGKLSKKCGDCESRIRYRFNPDEIFETFDSNENDHEIFGNLLYASAYYDPQKNRRDILIDILEWACSDYGGKEILGEEYAYGNLVSFHAGDYYLPPVFEALQQEPETQRWLLQSLTENNVSNIIMFSEILYNGFKENTPHANDLFLEFAMLQPNSPILPLFTPELAKSLAKEGKIEEAKIIANNNADEYVVYGLIMLSIAQKLHEEEREAEAREVLSNILAKKHESKIPIKHIFEKYKILLHVAETAMRIGDIPHAIEAAYKFSERSDILKKMGEISIENDSVFEYLQAIRQEELPIEIKLQMTLSFVQQIYEAWGTTPEGQERIKQIDPIIQQLLQELTDEDLQNSDIKKLQTSLRIYTGDPEEALTERPKIWEDVVTALAYRGETERAYSLYQTYVKDDIPNQDTNTALLEVLLLQQEYLKIKNILTMLPPEDYQEAFVSIYKRHKETLPAVPEWLLEKMTDTTHLKVLKGYLL